MSEIQLLMFFNTHDPVLSPKGVYANMEGDLAYATIKDRMSNLEDAGLLKKSDDDFLKHYYEITEEGQKLMNHNMDSASIAELNPE